jgi:N6-L-threonylcarbamoyladenine synthase
MTWLLAMANAQSVQLSDGITILGIESSCDDTAAAVVVNDQGIPNILSSVVSGQDDLHAAYGGVVPEIAARAHAERVDICVEKAISDAGISLKDIDAIAVTAGPGLIGGVLSGVMAAKGLAAGLGKPLIGVNHLAGHALTPRMTDNLPYPYLMLLVSGGHCQFLAVLGHDNFVRMGGTIDDAPGEAFDKTAKLLGLGYPGGPLVEAEAQQGDPHRFKFPRPLLNRPGCDMSFSGLKTALRRARDELVETKGGITRQDRADLCASFQIAIADTLAEKTRRALAAFDAEYAPANRHFAVAGGVAANTAVRSALDEIVAKAEFTSTAPPLRFCTDNAAMIAWAGSERFLQGQFDGFDLAARPRWPLDQNAQPMLGSGKRGAKA